ncbi:MAG: hypothetical protein AABM64_17450, partial [Pseudomonadota bacterium]
FETKLTWRTPSELVVPWFSWRLNGLTRLCKNPYYDQGAGLVRHDRARGVCVDSHDLSFGYLIRIRNR